MDKPVSRAMWMSAAGGGQGLPLHYPYQIYSRIADVCFLTGQWQRAERIHRDGIEWARAAGEERILADLCNGLGSLLTQKGEYAEALRMLEEARGMFQKHGDQRALGDALGNIGLVQFNRGNLDEAIRLYREKLDIAAAGGDRKGASYALGNIGLVHLQRGDLAEAGDCFRRCLEMSREINDRRSAILALGNIGVIHWYRKEYEEAVGYFQRSLQEARAIGNKQGVSYALGNIGLIYDGQGRYREALEQYRRCRTISAELGDVRSMMQSSFSAGDDHEALGEYGLAREDYLRYLAEAEALGDQRERCAAMGLVARTYGAEVRVAEAGVWYQRAADCGIAAQAWEKCCQLLLEWCDLCAGAGQPDRAREHLSRARELAQAHSLDDRCGLMIDLLAALVEVPDRAAAAALSDLLPRAAADNELARIHFELCRLTGDTGHCREATRLYRSLSAGAPRAEYRARLDSLAAIGISADD
ncbi:MAG: tetratricopeptide repeat protein [Candidatus Edwardsbacteria bacterium]|nr:tetratricopeptide repeat protein [Candidatus Edwardsbacteria bacterium]